GPHHEGVEEDPDADPEADLADAGDGGDEQGGEGAGQDETGRGDRPAGEDQAFPGGVGHRPAGVDLLPDPPGDEDVVVGTQGHQDHEQERRQPERQPRLTEEALKHGDRDAHGGQQRQQHAGQQVQRGHHRAEEHGQDDQDGADDDGADGAQVLAGEVLDVGEEGAGAGHGQAGAGQRAAGQLGGGPVVELPDHLEGPAGVGAAIEGHHHSGGAFGAAEEEPQPAPQLGVGAQDASVDPQPPVGGQGVDQRRDV